MAIVKYIEILNICTMRLWYSDFEIAQISLLYFLCLYFDVALIKIGKYLQT